MALQITPERGVPIQDTPPPKDLTGKAEAAAETAKHLHAHGLKIDITAEDRDNASEISMAYAADPVRTSKKATLKNISRTPPATLLLTDKILKDFGHSVVESATQVRHLVTNKLIEETENPDPRVRIRALELLGKISDVGLFAEKSEVTITHQTTDDIKEKLRGKLAKLINPADSDVEDAVVVEAPVISLDDTLGPSDA
jgi:hypothetical protein